MWRCAQPYTQHTDRADGVLVVSLAVAFTCEIARIDRDSVLNRQTLSNNFAPPLK